MVSRCRRCKWLVVLILAIYLLVGMLLVYGNGNWKAEAVDFPLNPQVVKHLGDADYNYIDDIILPLLPKIGSLQIKTVSIHMMVDSERTHVIVFEADLCTNYKFPLDNGMFNANAEWFCTEYVKKPVWLSFEIKHKYMNVRIGFHESEVLVRAGDDKISISDITDNSYTQKEVYSIVVIKDEGKGPKGTAAEAFGLTGTGKLEIKGYASNLYFYKELFDATAKSKKWNWHWLWDWVYYSRAVVAAPINTLIKLFYDVVGLRIGWNWAGEIVMYGYDWGNRTLVRLDQGHMFKINISYSKDMHVYHVFLFRVPVNEEIQKRSKTLSDSLMYHTFVVFSLVHKSAMQHYLGCCCFYAYYLPLLHNIDKACGSPETIQFYLHNSSLRSPAQFYHVFTWDPVVYVDQWISLEKNGKELTMQLSSREDDVINKFRGEPRRPPELIQECISMSDPSAKHIAAYLMLENTGSELPSLVCGLVESDFGRRTYFEFLEFLKSSKELEKGYFLTSDNCQLFSKTIFDFLTAHKKWDNIYNWVNGEPIPINSSYLDIIGFNIRGITPDITSYLNQTVVSILLAIACIIIICLLMKCIRLERQYPEPP